MTLFEELKRRKVFRVAGTYAVVAWILMQIGEVTFPALNIPEWVMSTLVVVLLAGFPIAIIFAWIFDKTPEGFIKTKGEFENVDNSKVWYTQKRTYFTILGILFGFIIGIYGPNYFKDNDFGTDESKEIQKLAILPFSNIRPDNETDFLGYALSDEIINRLGYLKSLIVRPATAVRQYRGQEVSPERVGEELEVNLILTGSYLRNQDRLRLNTELMNINTKELIWQKSMTVNYDDIFAIQDSVAGLVINGLKGQISNEDKINEKEIEPKDPKAYELYLKAKAINPVVIGDYRRQVSYLKQSLDLDEEFAPAWAQLGFAYHRLGNFGVDLKTNAVNAESAFLQTLKINPTNRQVYGLLIQFYTDQNRLIEAYSYGKKGLHLYPNDSRIIGYLGYAVRYAGLLEESIRFTDKSVQLEFDSYEKTRLLNDIARGYFYLGDSELGRRKFDDLINFMKEEEIEIPSYLIFYDGMWDLYVNNNQSAYDKFDILMELDPTQIFSKYGQVYKNILQGNRSKALKIIDELNKIVIYDGEQYYRFIQFYSLLGMPKEAIQKMKGTLDRGFFPYPYFQSDKFLDPIRKDPGFARVLTQIKAKHIEFNILFESTMDMNFFSDAKD